MPSYLVHTVCNVSIERETWRVTSATSLSDEDIEQAVCGQAPESVTDLARIDMETKGADRTLVAIEVEAEPTHARTGEPTTAARAARVGAALDTYAQHCYGTLIDRADHAMVAQDFLTDVLHWIHQHGQVPGEIAQRAVHMFLEEIAQENR